jgi:Cupin domain
MRRKRVAAGSGEVVVVPPGVPHDFANVGDEPALVRVDIRPALKMEQLFETAVALAEQGRTMMNGSRGRSTSRASRASSRTRCRRRSRRRGCSVSPSRRLLARRRGHGALYAREPAVVPGL